MNITDLAYGHAKENKTAAVLVQKLIFNASLGSYDLQYVTEDFSISSYKYLLHGILDSFLQRLVLLDPWHESRTYNPVFSIPTWTKHNRLFHARENNNLVVNLNCRCVSRPLSCHIHQAQNIP